MKFSLLLGFISIGLSVSGKSALLGSKVCTFGPSYWCGSIRNAKECNAVKHCIQTVWEKKVLPADNDDVCSICKNMVQEARDQLLSDETQEEIQEVFEGSCKLIPIDLIRDECIKLSDEFIPELIDTLASQMDPQVVCATAGLCNSAYVDRLLREYKKEHDDTSVAASSETPEPGDCQDCKAFIKDTISIVQTHSRADLLDHLLAVCGRLSSLSDGCMALVQSNFEEIYIFLTQQLKPGDACELFGMCERMYGKTLVTLPNTGDEPCDFCVAIITNWRNNLIANTTKEELKMILEGICQQTGKFADECLSLVDQYVEPLYDFLVSEIHPKDICEAIGFCGPNSIFKNDVPLWPLMQMRSEDRLPMVPLQPSFDINDLIGQDELNSYKHNIPLTRVALSRSSVDVVSIGQKGLLTTDSHVQKSDACVMCEFTLHFLQNVLSDHKTREKIENEVEKVCKLLPRSVIEECEDYIEAYGDQVIQLIILEIDPATICPMLKLCPGSRKVRVQKQGSTCVLCEYAMTTLDEILKNKSNEESIKDAIERICSMMPKDVYSKCKNFIDTYVDQIIDLIANDFTPNQICKALGLCPCQDNSLPPLLFHPEDVQLPVSRYFIPSVFQQADVKQESTAVVQQSAVCVICEFIMTKIDAMLLSNATVGDIKNAVDRVCLLLPTTLMNDCLGFMEEYADSLIELLVNYMQPSSVCRELKFCKDTFQLGLPKAMTEAPVDKCWVCEKVMDRVKQDKTTDESLIETQKLLHDVCPYLPAKTEKTCSDMVVNYGQFLGKLLEELKDAKLVCQALKMCPHHGPQTLLGSKKCTWGPSYWCQSRLHAEACKATKHCIEKVWKSEDPSA